MMTGIHEKGMSNKHRVKVNNLPEGTSATILENIDQLVKSKLGCLIVHAETNDLANGTNLLNEAKNYCNNKNIDSTDNGNLKVEHLGQKKLHLNKKGNSIMENNFIK